MPRSDMDDWYGKFSVEDFLERPDANCASPSQYFNLAFKTTLLTSYWKQLYQSWHVPRNSIKAEPSETSTKINTEVLFSGGIISAQFQDLAGSTHQNRTIDILLEGKSISKPYVVGCNPEFIKEHNLPLFILKENGVQVAKPGSNNCSCSTRHEQWA